MYVFVGMCKPHLATHEKMIALPRQFDLQRGVIASFQIAKGGELERRHVICIGERSVQNPGPCGYQALRSASNCAREIQRNSHCGVTHSVSESHRHQFLSPHRSASSARLASDLFVGSDRGGLRPSSRSGHWQRQAARCFKFNAQNFNQKVSTLWLKL